MRPKRESRAAKHDSDQGDGEWQVERHAQNPECRRKSGEQADDHEDQPHVVGLPHRGHRVVRVLADARRVATAPRGELPRAGAEVGAREDGVQRQPDEREDQRQLVQVHLQAPAIVAGGGELGRSSGARASRRRTHATATATPRYTAASTA